MSEADQPSGLRVVTFNVLPVAYESVAKWAERHGHRIVLIVTTPGPPARRRPVYRGVVALAPPETDILVTTRPRRVALPLIRALEPDLIISASFPYRIPQEIVVVPRYGAMNLHPAPLPRYRGPNPLRLVYEGFPTMGATLHRIVEEFDAGPILSQPTMPLPEWVTPEALRESLNTLIERAIEEGTARAVAGEPGTPQDETLATYAAPFTEEEHWLDWAEFAQVLQRKAAALNLFHPAAKARLDGQEWVIERLTRADTRISAAPGIILERNDGEMVVAVGDGAVRIVTQ
ncbi:MAG: hypothetical protein M3008_01645 [Chloroflexota bacterium]|nr:hypothetical protein [Chloroflexota bacterium]